MLMRQILDNGAQQFKLSLSQDQLTAFERYSHALITWNRRVNLTRILDPQEIAVKHFLDSLSVSLALPEPNRPFLMIDVGSGPGFPGLPLKIALPAIRPTLLESTIKKTAFLQHLVDHLDLKDVTILTDRAETVGHQPAHRQVYDVAVARAVAALPVLAEYTLPLVKVGGRVILQKGQHPAEEIEATTHALSILGGRITELLPVTIPGLHAARHLVIIEKYSPTPARYPRRPGLPGKKPL